MNKGMSNSGAIHLLRAENSNVAACATGKVQPLVTPLTAAEGDRPLTCKRCLRLHANITAAQATAAIDAALADTATQAEQDALLAEATGQPISAVAEAVRDGKLITRPAVDEATASDTEAAEEAAERDAAVEGIMDQLAGTGRDSREVEAELDAQATPAAPAPTQKTRVNQKALVLAFLEAHPGQPFTPHQISKAVTPAGAKALGLRDVCARLAADDKIEIVEGTKAATYRMAELPADATA